jgi:hypothetical protein
MRARGSDSRKKGKRGHPNDVHLGLHQFCGAHPILVGTHAQIKAVSDFRRAAAPGGRLKSQAESPQIWQRGT